MKIKLSVLALALCSVFNLWAQEENLPDPALNEEQEQSFKFLEKTAVLEEEVPFRVIENLSYVKNPKNADIQLLNFYVPEPYFRGEKIGEWTKDNAPIFLINSSQQFLTQKPENEKSPVLLSALKNGFMVASIGVRGKNAKGEDAKFSGKAPNGIVDLKAAVQFLHANDEKLLGDAKKIIAYGKGTVAGEVLVLGTSTANQDFNNYLEELGVEGEDNSVFAVIAYSPITNLENADAAYEWQFGGKNIPPKSLDDGKMAASEELRAQFTEYLNNLNLSDEQGNALKVNPDGSGTFRDYLQNLIMQGVKEQNLEQIKWLTLKDGEVVAMDWDGFIKAGERVMQVPYFDSFELNSPYNEIFGTASIDKKHFTEISQAQDNAGGVLAEDRVIKMLNPMNYIQNTAGTKHYFIRQGILDNSNSLAIPALLALELKNADKSVNFALTWGDNGQIAENFEEINAWVWELVKAEEEKNKPQQPENKEELKPDNAEPEKKPAEKLETPAAKTDNSAAV